VSNVQVEGRAEQNVKADLFVWEFTYSAVGDKAQDAKESVKNAKKEITALLDNAGLIKDEDYTVKPRELSHTKTDAGADVFTISQRYEVKTQKMEEAVKAYKLSEKLADEGIAIVSDKSRMYQIKDKTNLEKQLIAKALEDAKERAVQIEKITGGRIIGVPEIAWSRLQLRDSNASEEYYWDGGSTIDQIATLTLTTNYKMK
jgi:hypothetical protein